MSFWYDPTDILMQDFTIFIWFPANYSMKCIMIKNFKQSFMESKNHCEINQCVLKKTLLKSSVISYGWNIT